jgi:hypothetical protein
MRDIPCLQAEHPRNLLVQKRLDRQDLFSGWILAKQSSTISIKLDRSNGLVRPSCEAI